MKKAAPPRLARFPAAKQRRLDQLLEKNSGGTITPAEKAKLEALVAEAERLMVANARRLAAFSRNEQGGAPDGGVPVTVWVRPERAGR